MSSRKQYHEFIEAGDSIKVRQNESSTAGLYLTSTNAEASLLCIPASHACNEVSIGSSVLQPSVGAFAAECKETSIRLLQSRASVTITSNDKVRKERRRRVEELEKG